jgi:predicted nucleotidyltransferase
MNQRDLIHEKRDEIRRIAQKHGAVDIRLFGSVARGEATEESDIDLLVELEEGRSLLDVGGMLMELREALGVEVDLTTTSSLPRDERERILESSASL